LVPKELKDSIQVGMRIIAPFRKRNMNGVVVSLSDKSVYDKVKTIVKLIDLAPSINDELLQFCKWISGYYICPLGEVIFAAIPKGSLIESKIVYRINPAASFDIDTLPPSQLQIVNSLLKKPLTIKQIANKLDKKNIYSPINDLIDFGILEEVQLSEKPGIKPRYESTVHFELLDELIELSTFQLDLVLNEYKIKAESQRNILKYLISNQVKKIKLSDLTKEISVKLDAVKALQKKDLINITQVEVIRELPTEFTDDAEIKDLNTDQKNVLNVLKTAIDSGDYKSFLLHGVTGSGKTQVYIETIKYVLAKDKTAIVLVPEISLTPQLINRFKNYFGDVIGIIHSKLSEGQRFDVYRRILSGNIKIIIGARSALFAPLKNLGIIVVDEEHDSSYKQTEKKPYYHGRDASLVRAKLNSAIVILGSATPSLESYYNVKINKNELLELPHRALKNKPPQIEIVNMLAELKAASAGKKEFNPDNKFLSSKLIYNISQTLKNNKSIILLQNRRGYSPFLECQECGYVKLCRNCDITLTFHKVKQSLICHYCGEIEEIPVKCDRCNSSDIKFKGAGTEKVEEDLEKIFKNVKLQRMDSDTVKRADAHRKILKSFYDGEFKILIGTQMISKGLDFPNVHLVGVISADLGLFNPDFRSTEKTFQLLMQVAGRSGRNVDYGKVFIQTMHPQHYIFELIKNHDYRSFYNKEIESRKNFEYPPFSRMTLIEISGSNVKETYTLASKIYMFLNKFNKSQTIQIFKPAPSIIYKIKNKFRYNIIIKSVKYFIDEFMEGKPSGVKEVNLKNTEILLHNLVDYLISLKPKKDLTIHIDVDPISFI
jgi:primosomal protein N' (replication factor Y) (superfamily II helicase)